MIYEDLIKQYEKLSEEEKNALLVYKSRLGRAINSLDNNPLEIKEIYEQYKMLLNDSKNIFMKFTVFKDISFENLEAFKSSLLKTKEIVKEASTKIILPEDVTTYRAFSISKEDELSTISRTDLISTSLNINECSKYLIPNKGYTHYLYQINLEKGSMVTICPYRILIDNNGRLTLTKENNSEEIIISKDNYDFDSVIETTTELNAKEELNIISINAISKEKDTKLKR